jgi:molybdopterin-synthase adenylyltransferase
MLSTELSDRYLRQQDIIPRERMAECRVSVIGVGAIGRQTALQLAAMGVPWMQLVDPDVVEAVNLAPQGYWEDEIGHSKVNATAQICRQINGSMEIILAPERFKRSMDVGNVVFCCVDSIATRELIWNALKSRVEFFADARMSAEVLRVLTAADSAGRRHYPTTFFREDEAFQGACTARSTIFCASIAAGMMLSQFSRWLRRMPVDPDLYLNLLASELTVPVAS